MQRLHENHMFFVLDERQSDPVLLNSTLRSLLTAISSWHLWDSHLRLSFRQNYKLPTAENVARGTDSISLNATTKVIPSPGLATLKLVRSPANSSSCADRNRANCMRSVKNLLLAARPLFNS